MDPGMDLPEPRIGVGGAPLRYRHGNLHREQRREPRQPLELLPAGSCRTFVSRESDRKIVAQSKDGVIGSFALDPMQRQGCPLWELLLEKTPYERVADVDLIFVHAGH